MKKSFVYCFVFCITFLFLSEFISIAYNYENDIEMVIIGIDLGTTYSRVGVYRNDTVEIIANYPSWVAFPDTDHLVADAAKNQASFNPKQTIFGFKRFIGKKFDDLDVERHVNMLPYEVLNEDGKPYVQIEMNDGEFKVVSINEIIAMVLRKMKESAESYLGKEIKHAIISVPVNFTYEQMQEIRDTAVVAGLNVVRIINEPTAAAIAYGFVESEDVKTILVYDLGGGTFDVSITIIEGGVVEILATDGDIHLGGEDFNDRVVNYFVELIMKKYNKDISQDKKALVKLRMECERAKRELSSQHQVQVEIESLFDGTGHFSEQLTRGKFEELNIDLFKKTMDAVERVMNESQLKKSEIDEFVLVGGSSRIPKVHELLKEYFNGKEPYKGTVNPDEAVVHGAIVQGGFISTAEAKRIDDQDLLLVLVFPRSLGIETVGGVMTTLIPEGTILGRTKKSQIFTTSQDNQTTVSIKVYEGSNLELVRFDLSGIAPAARGVPEIEVTFDFDDYGILNVTAEDKATQNSKSIAIELGIASKRASVMFYDGIQNVAAELDDPSKSIAIKNNEKNTNLGIHDEF